jgi:hypothetical protein
MVYILKMEREKVLDFFHFGKVLRGTTALFFFFHEINCQIDGG